MPQLRQYQRMLVGRTSERANEARRQGFMRPLQGWNYVAGIPGALPRATKCVRRFAGINMAVAA